jgi:hypothetical protein
MFTLPETYNSTKANGDPKSKTTIAMYKTHLNKISTATGYTTVEEFVKHPSKVVKAINEICAKKENESEVAFRSRKRVFYSAVFMVLPKEIVSKPNAFYLANKKLQDAPPSDFKEKS